MVRILNLIWTLQGGGAEGQLARLALALGQRGHEVHVGFVHDGVQSRALTAGACTTHHIRTAAKYDPLLPVRVGALMNRVKPDVVHTWLTYMDVLGGVNALVRRLPWVMSERSAALSYPPTPVNRLRVGLGRRADLIVANSAGGADYWRTHGVEPARVEIVPNHVAAEDIAAARPLDDPRIGRSDDLILHVGRLSAEKNVDALVRVFAAVHRARPTAKLAFCGDGPLMNSTKEAVASSGLTSHVVFAGFVTNVAAWLKRANVLVALSRCEGHPNAVLEATVAGVPLVLADIAAYRSLCADRDALFVPLTDERAISDAILITLSDTSAAAGRAAAARQELSVASIEATATRYEHAYDRAIAAALRGRTAAERSRNAAAK